ncbi:lmo0937 family membrane protein [Salipaludibacillus agaradhaerens]|nr:lmo0937 family membrane protein [Salipaludibacillus agaradhaerens]
MLWTIISILILFWLVGLFLDLVGGLIHLILVVALIVFIVKMIRGRG